MTRIPFNRLYVVGLACILLCFAPTVAFAQESAEYPDIDRYIANVSISAFVVQDGRILDTITPTRRVVGALELLRILKGPIVGDGLTLVEFQSEDVEKVLQDVMAAIKEYDHRFLISSAQITPHEIREIFQETWRQSTEVVNSILLSHQRPRLRELLWQFEVARIGMIGSLTYGSLSKELKIDGDQLKLLCSTSLTELDKYQDVIRKIRSDYFKAVFEQLRSEQQDELIRWLGQPEILDKSPVFLMIARQNPEFYETAKDKLEMVDDERVDSFFTYGLPSFEIEIDAQTVFDFRDILPSTTTDHIRLLVMLRNQKVSAQLELTNDQVSACDRMYAEWQSLKEEWNNDYPNFEGTLEEFQKKWNPIAKNQRVMHLSNLSGLLTDEQKAKIDELCIRNEIAGLGFSFSILFGQAGKRLKVDKTQRKRSLERLNAWAIYSREKLVDFERKTNAMLLKILTEEQREKYATLIGNDASLEQGLVEFHAALITNENRGARIIRNLTQDAQRRLGPAVPRNSGQ